MPQAAHKLRPASANQPLGPRWPATSALFSTQVLRCTERVLARLPLLLARLHGCVGTVYVHEVCRGPNPDPDPDPDPDPNPNIITITLTSSQ